MATDIVVETDNPDRLDRAAMTFGAAVIGGGTPEGYLRTEKGYYIVRCFMDVGFVKFAIEHQGYGKVITKEE